MRELGTSHYFSTMKIGRNVKDRKNGVVSLGTSHYFSKMAEGREKSLGTSHYFFKMAPFSYLHRYVLSLTL